MPRKYCEAEVVEMLKSCGTDIFKLHDAKPVKWTGTLLGTDRPYQDKVAEEFLGTFDIVAKLADLPTISRTQSYKVLNHDAAKTTGTNREEENLAMRMCSNREAGDLGSIIDYQIPLRINLTDPVGEIDLISVCDKSLHIIELKYSSENKTQMESILRASVQLSIYWQVLDKTKLISDFLPETSRVVEPVKKSLLLPASSYLGQIEMLNETRCKNLRSLLKKLGIEIFLYYLGPAGNVQKIVGKTY